MVIRPLVEAGVSMSSGPVLAFAQAVTDAAMFDWIRATGRNFLRIQDARDSVIDCS